VLLGDQVTENCGFVINFPAQMHRIFTPLTGVCTLLIACNHGQKVASTGPRPQYERLPIAVTISDDGNLPAMKTIVESELSLNGRTVLSFNDAKETETAGLTLDILIEPIGGPDGFVIAASAKLRPFTLNRDLTIAGWGYANPYSFRRVVSKLDDANTVRQIAIDVAAKLALPAIERRFPMTQR
jgi:hypothetical protein